MASLALDNISANSIKVYLSAIRQLHIQRKLCPPPIGDMARLAQVLRGIKISQASANKLPTRQRSPMTPELLHKIKVAWQKYPIDDEKIMLWAAFLTAFFGFMRSGELCAHSSKDFDPATVLSVNDVSVDDLSNPRLLRIHLKVSKTDPYRAGVDIFLARTDDDLCPVAAMLAWLVRRGKTPGPLFRLLPGKYLTHSQLVTKLREAINLTDQDPTKFSGHSFRSGAASVAAEQGISVPHIKLLGRWKSSAYQRYVKTPAPYLASLASGLSKQGRHS